MKMEGVFWQGGGRIFNTSGQKRRQESGFNAQKENAYLFPLVLRLLGEEWRDEMTSCERVLYTGLVSVFHQVLN